MTKVSLFYFTLLTINAILLILYLVDSNNVPEQQIPTFGMICMQVATGTPYFSINDMHFVEVLDESTNSVMLFPVCNTIPPTSVNVLMVDYR